MVEDRLTANRAGKSILLAVVAWIMTCGTEIHAETGQTNMWWPYFGGSTNITNVLTIGSGGSFNLLTIANQASVTNTANVAIGNGASATSNRVVVTDHSVWVITNANLTLATASSGNGGAWNNLTISNGSTLVVFGDVNVGGYTGAHDNSLYIGGLGAVSTGIVNGLLSVGPAGKSFSTMIVTNARLTSTGLSGIGVAVGGTAANVTNNAAFVCANGLWDLSGQQLNIGQAVGTGKPALSNSLTIDAGIVTNVDMVILGPSSGTQLWNSVVITNGGCLHIAAEIDVGNSTQPTQTFWSNTVSVVGGGLLDSPKLKVAPDTATRGSNSIINVRGIYQFATVAPTIAPGTPGDITINNGTISFRNVTNIDLKINWRASLTNMTFSGTNACRLNNATNSASTNQTYVFDPGLGATNYYRLEMVNGGTRYRGKPGDTLTIGSTVGSGGEMLCSNTDASVDLVFTNNGTLTLVNSTLTCGTNAALNGTVGIDLDYETTPAATPRILMTSGSALQIGAGAKVKLNSLANLPTGSFNRTFALIQYGIRSGTFDAKVEAPEGVEARLVYDDVNKVINVEVQKPNHGFGFMIR